MKRINISELKSLHDYGDILHHEPTSFDYFDIPEEFIDLWKKYLESKKEFEKTAKKYNINL